jgi:hypothetical protein
VNDVKTLMVLSADYRGFALVVTDLYHGLSLESSGTGAASIKAMETALEAVLPKAMTFHQRLVCEKTELILDMPEQPRLKLTKFCRGWGKLAIEKAVATPPDDLRFVLANALNENQITFSDNRSRDRIDFELSEDDGGDRIKSALVRAVAIAIERYEKPRRTHVTDIL